MPLSRRNLLTLLLTAAIPGLPAAVCAQLPDPALRKTESSEDTSYPAMPEVQAYIEETAAATQLPKSFIEEVLSQATYSARVEQLMTPKPRKPNAPKTAVRGDWRVYQHRMVGKSRIEKGSEFLEENDEAFGKAEDRYGIPRDIVASIIGVETVYGRNQGSFRVLDSLCTLTFDYKRRADYFRTELTEFLLLLREQHLDPATVYGSFAGAIGMGQFMPSSVRKYAVDFDGDGQIDLVGSSADAIGSVANYLSSHGWVRGLPPFFSCTPDSDADMRLVTGGITTDTTFDHALRAGFIPDFELNIPGDEPLMIVDLPYRDQDGKQATEYRLGTRNFQTILNYNHSYFYASAVSDLAEKIETISMDSAAASMASSSASS